MELFEPVVIGTLVFPDQYLGKLLKLCEVSQSIIIMVCDSISTKKKELMRLIQALNKGPSEKRTNACTSAKDTT